MPDRTREILEDLEAVRENLLALSDEIWISIDHNDPDALEEGVQFKRSYNDKMAAFDVLASELSAMIQQYTSVRLEEREESGELDEDQNERIIQALDREVPHAIGEDLTFKRPHGFILDGRGAVGVATWSRVFLLICRELYRRDPSGFLQLPGNPAYISNRGHHLFSQDPGRLRKPQEVARGLYIETNFSANGLRDLVRKLLASFAIPEDRLQFYLREDRDAWSDEV